MNEPHIWWYLARATGLIGWGLLTLSVLWGVLLSTRILRKFHRQAWLQDLHRFLGGLSLLFVTFHMIALMLDGWLAFTFSEVLIPGATDYKPLPVALGIVAFYLMFSVYATSLFMNRLPRRFWKIIHYGSYITVLGVALHAGLTGTDVKSFWYQMVAVTIIGLTTVSVLVRILVGKPRQNVEGLVSLPTAKTKEARVGTGQTLSLRLVDVSIIADNTKLFRFANIDNSDLPLWEPGSHITLYLPNNAEKQYSLCGDPADRKHYEIAVRKQPSGLGSVWLHDIFRRGEVIQTSSPANHFSLLPAASYVFIAGGIGITPIKAMIDSLPAKREWTLIYIGRNRSSMPFLGELEGNYPGRIIPVYGRPNVEQTIRAHVEKSTSSLVYFCGPEQLLNTVVSSVTPENRLHVERFNAVTRQPETATSFTVTTRTGATIDVAPEETILGALDKQGISIPASCKKGVCGSCETRVIAGTPEHLDSVMSDTTKDNLHIMYPCVSRSKSKNITLDI